MSATKQQQTSTVYDGAAATQSSYAQKCMQMHAGKARSHVQKRVQRCYMRRGVQSVAERRAAMLRRRKRQVCALRMKEGRVWHKVSRQRRRTQACARR